MVKSVVVIRHFFPWQLPGTYVRQAVLQKNATQVASQLAPQNGARGQ